MRAGLSVGVIVALVIAIWVAVSSGDDEPAPTTLETTTTSATTPTTTTTTPPPATTATTSGSTTTPTETTVDEEARIEEVRLILEGLWFQWLHALFRGDTSAVNTFVATESLATAFENAIGNVEFEREPEVSDIKVAVFEILRDAPDCLVVHARIDASDVVAGNGLTEGVDVLWPKGSGWRLAKGWTHPKDLWQADCESEREELP